jgi:hypothetical protein
MILMLYFSFDGESDSHRPHWEWYVPRRVVVSDTDIVAGSAILTQALASPHISHVTTLSRKAPYTDTSNPKLTSLIIQSGKYPNGFGEFPPSLVEAVKGNSAIIWALGVSQTQVSKEEYLT